MKNYNIQSYLPLFEGFYNSNEDAKIDNDIEMDIDYYLEEHNKKISFSKSFGTLNFIFRRYFQF